MDKNRNKTDSIISRLKKLSILQGLTEENPVIFTDRITGSLKTFTAINILKSGRTCFLPCKDIITAKKTKSELELLGYEEESVFFSLTQTDLNTPSVEEVLQLLLNKNFIVVTTYEAFLTPVAGKETFTKNLISLKSDSIITYDELIELLNSYNYSKEEFVEERGDYSVRGAIIDVFSFSHANPVRIEFDGDRIHSLRLIDVDSQRSFQAIDEYTIFLNEAEQETPEKNNIEEFAGSSVAILSEEYLPENFTPNPGQGRKYIIQKFLTEDNSGDSEYFSFNSKAPPVINSNLEVLTSELKKLHDGGYRISIYAEQESHATRLKDLITEYNNFIAEIYDEGLLKIEMLPIQEGFILQEEKWAIFTEHEIFNRPFSLKTKYRKVLRGASKHLLSTIKKGDFVVHSDYGIGQFAGLEQLTLSDYPQEVMKLLYENGDVVYVNINYLHKVKKYSSKDSSLPKLSRLGSAEWKRTTRKLKEKIAEAVTELIRLYAERKNATGFQFSPDTIWQKELEADFYYEDTPDQIKVTEEIKKDMESPNPMDRLVCGDVGFGKTEVAVRAAFKSVMDNKQVALLVPTTILAEQHFNTFTDRLSKYPVKISVLSRFIKKQEQKEIIKNLAEGKVDILIGTHRILSKDIVFKNLGLLIVDEEHRFGVMAKEKIRQFKANVDTIYLTATPIPRTLNMSLSGSKDISIIATPPPNRLPIITEISKFSIEKVREVILNEMGRDGQIFFVHDRVKSIEKMTAYLRQNVPEAKFGIAHGQMKPDEIEDVLHGFLKKKFNVLVSTKIIESGLDIPNANTIIINRADRFGLAELYQLRGRVGRANKQAYAYLFVPSLHSLTRNAIQRIQAFEEFSELGSGFNLSMRDLEIRGAGNLIGTEQSGFINSVGFETYMKILEETVEEVKQKEFKELFAKKESRDLIADTIIDVHFDYNIPPYYIEFQDERLYYYTKLFTINNLNEIDDLQFEIKDKYGEPPAAVENLFDLAKLKFLASRACFEKIEVKRNQVLLTFPKKEMTIYYEQFFQKIIELIMKKYSDSMHIYEYKEKLKVRIEKKFESYKEASEFLKYFLKEVSAVIQKNKEKDI